VLLKQEILKALAGRAGKEHRICLCRRRRRGGRDGDGTSEKSSTAGTRRHGPSTHGTRSRCWCTRHDGVCPGGCRVVKMPPSKVAAIAAKNTFECFEDPFRDRPERKTLQSEIEAICEQAADQVFEVSRRPNPKKDGVIPKDNNVLPVRRQSWYTPTFSKPAITNQPPQ